MTAVMRFSMVVVVGLLVVCTPLQVAGAGGNGKSPKSPRSPAARAVAAPEITMSEDLHAIGWAVLLLGRHLDMLGVAVPTVGMRVWAMFGSLSQRLAGHFFYPAVVMAVRTSEGFLRKTKELRSITRLILSLSTHRPGCRRLPYQRWPRGPESVAHVKFHWD